MKKWTGLLALLLLAWFVFGFEGRAQNEASAQEEVLETFVPSEELPADQAISFPADI